LNNLFKDAFPDMEAFYNWLVNLSAFAGANFEILTAFFGAFGNTMVNATKSTEGMLGFLELVRLAFLSLAVPVALAHDAIEGLWWIFREGVEAGMGVLALLNQKIAEFALSAAQKLDKLPFVDMTEEIKWLNQEIEASKAAQEKAWSVERPNSWFNAVMTASNQSQQAMNEFAKKAAENFDKVGQDTSEMTSEWYNYLKVVKGGEDTMDNYYDSTVRYFDKFKDELDTLENKINAVPEEIQNWVKALRDAGIEVEDVGANMIKVKGSSDQVAFAVSGIKTGMEATGVPITTMENGMIKIGEAANEVDKFITKDKDGMILLTNETEKAATQTIRIKDGVVTIGDEVDKVNEKGIDLKTATVQQKMDLLETSMKTIGGVIQTYIEWEAKIEIKKLEEDTKLAVASAETIRDSFVAAAEATAAAFGGFGDISAVHFYEYLALVERQLKVQEDLAAAQIAFTNEQSQYFKLRNEALRRGEAASQVNVAVEGDMEGWLAGLVESLFKDIMVKASAESFNVLAQG
jgi:hypothetical protein